MSILHTDRSEQPSERERIALAFVDWLDSRRWASGAKVFNAPYGIIQGYESGKRARGITFGLARWADIHLSIYSPTFMILRDSRHGQAKCRSINEVRQTLVANWNIPPQ